ncbi:MAG: hypothetical protein KAJ01_10720 [Candidatus Hydrogenedentes bacterium]|nr:hypothetical protein [Candidatus Hydrogenedentota bacterium]
MFQEIKFDYVRGRQNWEEFMVKVRNWEADNHDQVVESRTIAYRDDDSLVHTAEVANAGDNPFYNGQPLMEESASKLTRHALGQFIERMDGPPLRWFADERHTDGALRAEVMNDVIRHRENKELLLRNRNQGGETIVRSVLSDQYGVFNHDEFVGLIANAIDNMSTVGERVEVFGGEIGDKMRGYVLLPNVVFGQDPRGNGRGGGDLHPSVYIHNSETGTGKVRIHGGLYSSVCDNGVIYGWNQDAGLELIHRSISRRTIASMVADACVAAFKLSEEAAEKFIAAERIFLEPLAIENLATKWADKYGLTLGSVEAWSNMIEVESAQNGRRGEPTLFDVVNAATFTAQAQEPDERELMERLGGDLLFAELPERFMAQERVLS